MLCTNFRIKTFYLNGNSNPTGTCLHSLSSHHGSGFGFFFFAQDFLRFVLYSREAKAPEELPAAVEKQRCCSHSVN